jgi:hypothetical protein
MVNDECGMMNERQVLLIHHSAFIVHHLKRLRRFGDLAGLDARGADLHADVAALRALDADGLKVGVEAAARAVVRVRDVIPELRPLAADFASFSHYFENLRTLKKPRPSPCGPTVEAAAHVGNGNL